MIILESGFISRDLSVHRVEQQITYTEVKSINIIVQHFPWGRLTFQKCRLSIIFSSVLSHPEVLLFI